jgi:hypothetical protein
MIESLDPGVMEWRSDDGFGLKISDFGFKS